MLDFLLARMSEFGVSLSHHLTSPDDQQLRTEDETTLEARNRHKRSGVRQGMLQLNRLRAH